jgi:oligopeptide transport system permease protein
MDQWTKEDFILKGNENDFTIDNTVSGDSYWKGAAKRFFGRKSNLTGLVLLILLVVLAVFAPILSPYDYAEQNLDRADLAPRIPYVLSGTEKYNGTGGAFERNKYQELGLDNVYYFFGTDNLGRDLFSRCFMGLRVSLMIALVAALINVAIGMNYGMISGYLGGRTDFIMQQIVDIAGSIPTLVVVTLLMIVLKPGVGSIIVALMLTGWMEMSIITRAQTLRYKDREFVLAARTLGAGNSFILFKELLPNIAGSLITQIMVTIPDAIFLETFLSFLGLGLPVGSCSLGRLISEGFDNCILHSYMLFPCVIILVVLMIACNLVADGLKEAFDPDGRA